MPDRRPAPVILVTPRAATAGAGHPALQPLRAAGFALRLPSPGRMPSRSELLAALPGCVGWLAGVETIDGGLLAGAADLQVISRNGTGVDAIDLAAATRHGIAVRRAAGANARGVAELTIGLLFALSRGIPSADSQLKNGTVERRPGIELAGRTLGLVGCGTIGRLVAKLALGLGMRVVAYDPRPDPGFAPADGFAWADLPTVLAGCDALSLHCPPGGPPLIDADALARLRPGVLLINTARAELMDAHAVAAALASGRLGGLATDVSADGDIGADPLVGLPGVIATPHLGGFTGDSVQRALDEAVANLLDGLVPRSAS